MRSRGEVDGAVISRVALLPATPPRSVHPARRLPMPDTSILRAGSTPSRLVLGGWAPAGGSRMVWWSDVARSGAPASGFFSGIANLWHRGCVEGRPYIYRQRTKGRPNKNLRVLRRATFEAPEFMRFPLCVRGRNETEGRGGVPLGTPPLPSQRYRVGTNSLPWYCCYYSST
jgi:hypothetical protein